MTPYGPSSRGLSLGREHGAEASRISCVPIPMLPIRDNNHKGNLYNKEWYGVPGIIDTHCIYLHRPTIQSSFCNIISSQITLKHALSLINLFCVKQGNSNFLCAKYLHRVRDADLQVNCIGLRSARKERTFIFTRYNFRCPGPGPL
jgi:hypothetical protein